MKAWISWIQKRHPDLSPDQVRYLVTQYIGYISIGLNTFLGLVKLIAGFAVHSISVRADGFNNLADGLGNLGLIIFTFKSRQKPDRKHPYGYARLESIATLILAMIIGFFGYQVLVDVYNSLRFNQHADFSTAVLWLLLLSMSVKSFMAYHYFRAARLIDSPMLRAYGVDARNDVISTLFVLISNLALDWFGVDLDAITGVLMAGIIFWSAIDLMRSVVSRLLGEAADPKLIEQLKQVILHHEGVMDVHDIKLHDYGPGQMYGTVHIEVLDHHQSLIEAHDLIDHIERQVLYELKINLVAHLDPVTLDEEPSRALKSSFEQIIRNIDESWRITDFRRESRKGEEWIIFDLEIPFGQDFSEDHVVELIREHLRQQDPSLDKCRIILKIEHV